MATYGYVWLYMAIYGYGMWVSLGCGVGLSSHRHAPYIFIPFHSYISEPLGVLSVEWWRGEKPIVCWDSGGTARQFPRCCRGACCDANSSGQIHPQTAQAQTTHVPRGCLNPRRCHWTEERCACSHTRLHVIKADKLKHNKNARIVVPLLEDVNVNHGWFLYLWSSRKW